MTKTITRLPITTLRKHFSFIGLCCVSALFYGPSALIAQQTYPFRDPSLPTAKRVGDIVSRLTLEEKISQLQDNSIAIPRLGIPAYTWGNEGLHGDAFTGYTTLFPQVIGMAATWDTDLVYSMADVVSTEARARYNAAVKADASGRFLGISFWAPNINIFRDPRWGRGQETYGEDPFLTGRMAVAYVTGLQGNDPKYLKSLATPKHFAVHSGPEAQRHGWESYVSAHDLADTYLPAFRAAIVEGHAGAVMCAYNRINGIPSCASPWLLTSTLRGTWNFDGYIMSDCGAVADIADGHKYRPNYEQASAAAIHAGMDIACDWVPDGVRTEYSYLLEAVHDHLVSESEIDQALRRVLTERFRLGMFDSSAMVPYSSITDAEINSPAHAALAERAARESIVLLKNEDAALPLKHPGKIAVIGPNADLLQAIEGNYNAVSLNPVTPLIGIGKRFGSSSVLYAQGSLLAASLPIVIEYTALHPSPTSKEFGLKGDYFSNTTFSGDPTVTRLDRIINFDWDKASPAPGVPNENYSIRWTGTFTPPGAGVYIIGAKGKGCTNCGDREVFQLFVDGRLILENGKTHTVQMRFLNMRPHSIRLDYVHHLVPTHHLVAAGIDLLWAPPGGTLLSQALHAVSQADTTVVCVGLSPELEGEELPVKLPGFLGGDRTDINLPASQENLLKAVAASGKPFIVVLMNGSAIVSSEARDHAAALLEAWYPGQAGGDAIAATLAGDNNPSGRLPVTFYASTSQLPDFRDYSMERRTYRYFNDRPMYGFGFGLSYSTFHFSQLELSNDVLTPGQEIEAKLQITNRSSLAGDEVVELYLTPPDSPTTPFRKLIGFARIHLDAGQEKPVSFRIPSDVAMTVTENGVPTLLSGRYKLFVGDAQPREATAFAEAAFEVR